MSSLLPGLNPFTGLWFAWILLGLVFGGYNLWEAVLDLRAARRDRRQLTRIEAAHALALQTLINLGQLAELAASILSLVAVPSRPPSGQVGLRVAFGVIFLAIELCFQVLIANEFWRRRRVDGLAPAEFMRSALARTTLFKDTRE